MNATEIAKLALVLIGAPSAIYGAWQGIDDYLTQRAISKLNVKVLQCEVAALKRGEHDAECWRVVLEKEG